MTDDDIDHQVTIGWLRGHAFGLASAAEMLRSRAGKLFAGGLDKDARSTRQLAAELDEAAREQRRRCREYCEDQGLEQAPCDDVHKG